MGYKRSVLAILVPLVSLALYALNSQQAVVLGVFRTPKQTPIADPKDLVVISGTVSCEDLHYHASSQSIFTACEESIATRHAWFPPLGVFQDPVAGSTARGLLRVIDTKTMQSRRLNIIGYDGPFVTHGIDIISAPKSELGDEAIYILAVNHVPHTEYTKAMAQGGKAPREMRRADPRIETFYHVLGSDSALHVRTTKHPLIKTPNDIFAVNSTFFYVTNDHYYETGRMRMVEDIFPQAKWSTTVLVRVPSESVGVDSTCDAAVVLSGLHNNNGLGHSPDPNQILIGSATGGVVHFGTLPKDAETGIEISHTLQFDSTIDNPSYFSDPYANSTYDASGIVNAGLSRAVDLSQAVHDPEARLGVMVWHSRPVRHDKDRNPTGGASKEGFYETNLIFEDDGERISSASAALLVAIDPALEEQQRKAWLFVSGFMSRNIIAVKVNV